jgi:tetratricopeptide (TPR) repeat protein
MKWYNPVLLACLLSAGAARLQASPAPPPAIAPTFPGGTLEGPVERLVPKRPLSEADRDRLEATTLFAAGRAHEQREEYAQALRLYQRALRYDPQASGIAQAIVWLAYQEKQLDVAVRYLKRTAVADDDPALLHHLGIHVLEQEDFAGAAALLERALAAHHDKKEKNSAAVLLLRMELGRLYHLLEKHPQAADNFAFVARALEHPDEFDLDDKVQKSLLAEAGATYDLIGDCFLLADRPREAAAAFAKGHAKAPNLALLEYNLARVSARTGKAQEALAHLDKSLQLRLASEGPGPYELLGELLRKLGQESQWTPRLEKLHAADPPNLPLAYFLAARYSQAGQPDKAESLYQMLLKKAPRVAAYQGLMEIYRKRKDAASLLRVLGEAAADKGVSESLGAEGKTIAGDAALVRAIVAAARQRLSHGTDKLDYGLRLAVALLAMESKQYATAAEFFELAIAADPKQAADLRLLWGVGLLMDERAAEAVKVLQQGVDQKLLPEDNPLFSFYLAGALAMCDRTDEALAAARKVAVLKPHAPQLCSREAWILHRAKRYDEAIAAYAKLVAQFDADYQSDETRQTLREARLALSALCVLKQRLPEAEEWLEQVLDEFPDDVGADNDLGYLWADQGKHLARALAMIQKAVAAEPDNAAYRDSLGWIYYRLQRYPEAVVELEKAAAGKEPDAVVLDHLGEALAKAGQTARANETWRRAAVAFRKDKDEKQAKQVEAKIKPGPAKQ